MSPDGFHRGSRRSAPARARLPTPTRSSTPRWDPHGLPVSRLMASALGRRRGYGKGARAPARAPRGESGGRDCRSSDAGGHLGLDRDLLRLRLGRRLRRVGDDDLEDAVGVPRADLVRMRAGGQRDVALERALERLDPVVIALRDLLPLEPLAGMMSVSPSAVTARSFAGSMPGRSRRYSRSPFLATTSIAGTNGRSDSRLVPVRPGRSVRHPAARLRPRPRTGRATCAPCSRSRPRPWQSPNWSPHWPLPARSEPGSPPVPRL